MRKFENIKPLHLESPNLKEIPKYYEGKPIEMLGDLFGTASTVLNYSANAYNEALSRYNLAKERANKWTLWGKARKKQALIDAGSKLTDAAESYNTTRTNYSNFVGEDGTTIGEFTQDVPTPPTTEEIANLKLAYEASPSRAATTLVNGNTFAERLALRQARRLERNEALNLAQEDLAEGETISTGVKAGTALKNMGSHIAGGFDALNTGLKAIGNSKALAVGTQAMSMINPGLQTNLASDTDVNAGMDMAANIAGLLGPYGKLAEFGIKGAQAIGNMIAGNMKPKFSVDKDLQARQNASYMDTFKLVDKLSLGPGLSGVLFGSGEWRNKWQDAQAKYELTKGIDATSQDAQAAGRYEGIGMANAMDLNGGYTSLRAAKHGMKLADLKFARKAASGFRFNSFKMLEGEGINLANKDINPLDLQSLKAEDPLTKAIREAGGTNYTDSAGNTHVRVASNLLKTYKPSEIQEWYTKNHPNITVDWNLHSSSNASDLNLLDDALWEKNKVNILNHANEWWRSEDTSSDHSDNTAKFDINKFNDEQLTHIENAWSSANTDTFDKEAFSTALIASIPNITTEDIDGIINYLKNKKPGASIKKEGGVFTFFPATDEEVLKYKEGGSFNVIPEGALHKNKHNMDDADGLTKKGIPVVTIEDGEKILQAEIEVNEIIFRLEVTELLEKLAKENTDEAAIEAGKLLTKEILHNTHDNTGLIKEIN